MAGFQNLRVNRSVDFSGATLQGFGVTPFLSGGKVLFVDYLLGADGNAGTNPNYPKQTIASAFASLTGKTTGWHNDYIFIIASKDQDDAAAIAPTTTDAHWHLVGISNPQATFGVVLRMDSSHDTSSCIDLSAGSGLEAEIAGINFGGGSTGMGGILVGQSHGLWIHNNVFGHSFCGDTPAYGIVKNVQTNAENMLIEDNFFYGSATNANGKIATDGICVNGATPGKNIIIRRNTFIGIPGICINLDSTGGIITDNLFSLPSDTAGKAITVGTYSYACWINGNSANFGDTNAMGNLPYVDNSAGGADANNWGLNYQGGAAGYPA